MFRTNKKNEKGFTLVEVIVVAVIVAVLAAVAIPLYLNYIEDSRSNAATNAAGSIASFCGACLNSGEAVPAVADQTGGELTCPNGTTMKVPDKITITVEPDGTGGTVRADHTDGGIQATAPY